MLRNPPSRGRALACAFGLSVMLLAQPTQAQQSTLIPPGIGATDMPALRTYLTNAFSSVVQCFQGATAPAVGASGAKFPYQCWNDTSASPTIVHRIWNASTSTWIPAWTLDIGANSFSVGVSSTINAQVGANYTAADSDRGRLVDFSNGSGVAVTLPQASVSSLFLGGWYATYRNSGVGDVTITPTTSTIDGGASLVLKQGQSIVLRSDGTNYKTSFAFIGASTVAILSNKTYDTAASGNSFLINGLAATANTGTGSVVRATSPSLVTPNLGTPTSGTMTNVTGLPISTGVSGLAANVATFLGTPTSANLAIALTDETGTGAAVFGTAPTLSAPTISSHPTIEGVTSTGATGTGKFVFDASPALTGTPTAPTASGGTNTTQLATTAFVQSAVVASTTGVSSIASNTGAFTLGNGIDNATNQIQLTAARRTLPTVQSFLSGGASGTYTTPANVLWIEVRMVGGGGGSAGSGTTGSTNGTAGGNSTFGTTLLAANGGGAPAAAGLSNGGVGGTASLGSGPIGYALTGGGGVASNVSSTTYPPAGAGGASCLGGAGFGGGANSGGTAGAANTGGGGGGPGANNVANSISGASGGSGGCVYAIINSPASSYGYAVGAGGTAGGVGTSGVAGSAGGSGGIWVTEHYGS